MAKVAPHNFDRLGRWWEIGKRNLCKRCWFWKQAHPTRAWEMARPIGDRRAHRG